MKTHGPNAVDAATVDPWIESLATEPERAELDAADRALVDYALKLNDRPAAIDAADVETLRTVGFDDFADAFEGLKTDKTACKVLLDPRA